LTALPNTALTSGAVIRDVTLPPSLDQSEGDFSDFFHPFESQHGRNTGKYRAKSSPELTHSKWLEIVLMINLSNK
jgi:hypothetical protein